MKVIILPFEEFVPSKAPTSGIFQYHLALSLLQLNIQAGVISVTDPIAIWPLFVSIIRLLIKRKIYYKVIEGKSLPELIKLLLQQIVKKQIIEFENINGIPTIRVQKRCWNDSKTNSKLSYFTDCSFKGLDSYIEKFGRPSIIHAHNAWMAGIAAFKIKAKKGIPFCITEHSTFYSRGIIPGSYYSLLKKVYFESSKNIFVSTSLKELLQNNNLIDKNYIYIPNMIDPSFDKSVSLNLVKKEGDFIFLNIAELTKKKGHEILLKAFAAKFRNNLKVKLVIGGTGDLLSGLLELSKDLKITTQVSFLGALDRNAVIHQLNKSDCFVLPSLVETFGVVLIEAMACGVPVIATNCGGPETFVIEQCGIIVEPNNFEQFGKAMESMFLNVRKYDPIFIQDYAFLNFGSEKITNNIIKMYKNIISE